MWGPKADAPTSQETWPCFYDAEVIEDGQAIGVLLREFDGSFSAVRIDIKQVAD